MRSACDTLREPLPHLDLRQCKTCGLELHPGDLVCSQCHSLIYSEQLTIISARATRLEENGDCVQALAEWRKALPLLPADAPQADWVLEHIRPSTLLLLRRNIPGQPSDSHSRIGPLHRHSSSRTSRRHARFSARFWRLRSLAGHRDLFAIRAAVSLAGPLAGLLASVACLVLWWSTGDSLWAGRARASAWLNPMNLIFIWVLDGGQAANALDRNGRWAILASAVLFALFFQESAFFLVAAGAAWRLFTKDLPALPSYGTSAYYVCVMALLGIVLRCVPGHGFLSQ